MENMAGGKSTQPTNIQPKPPMRNMKKALKTVKPKACEVQSILPKLPKKKMKKVLKTVKPKASEIQCTKKPAISQAPAGE